MRRTAVTLAAATLLAAGCGADKPLTAEEANTKLVALTGEDMTIEESEAMFNLICGGLQIADTQDESREDTYADMASDGTLTVDQARELVALAEEYRCHDMPETAERATTTRPPVTKPPVPGVNERGNLPKQFGERIALNGPGNSSVALYWSVNAFALDAPCPDTPTRPDNGHFAFFEIEAETEPDMAGLAPDVLHSTISDTWSIIGPDGTTETNVTTGASMMCADSPPLTPGNTYRYMLVLDTQHTEGTLVYRPDEGAGWEWSFGASSPGIDVATPVAVPPPPPPAPAPAPAPAPEPYIIDCQFGLAPVQTYWSDGTVTGYSPYCQEIHDRAVRAESAANTKTCDADGVWCYYPNGARVPGPNQAPPRDESPLNGHERVYTSEGMTEAEIAQGCAEGWLHPQVCHSEGY